MKKIIVLAFLLCGVCGAYSQDCCDKVAEQAVVIDSLQKVIVAKQAVVIDSLQKVIKEASANNQKLKQELSDLEKYKSRKKVIDAQLKTKSDSIDSLTTQLSEKDKQIVTTRLEGDTKAQQEKERGKQEVQATIVNSYKNKKFDDLIKSSTKESVVRDMRLVGNNAEVEQVLNELKIYFNVKELLSKKFDALQIKNAQTQFNHIKQESSTLLDKLKETVDNYQTFNEGLKETINKIATLDRNESVAGMGDEIQEMKFNKISAYIFNYDFNLTDYPYLSVIVLEIIKRKQPNPDADISDLLNKLQ